MRRAKMYARLAAKDGKTRVTARDVARHARGDEIAYGIVRPVCPWENMVNAGGWAPQ